ncbi:MAG: biopolymer transporter ExbD [Thermodesulfobacteria bacterium]|nr:biopolymer transporter ExbD [Thermodesulfobacteriota bacterium]
MRRKRLKGKGVEIPVTPLIDIVFLLLIYFLLTSHFVEQEAFKVRLPETTSRGQVVEEALTITITREGDFFVNQRKVSPALLEEELKRIAAERAISRVHLEADREARVQWLVRAMEAAKEAGLKNVLVKTVRVTR